MLVFQMSNRRTETINCIDNIATSGASAEEIITNTLKTAISIEYFSRQLDSLAERSLRTAKLAPTAAHYLLASSRYDLLLREADQLGSDEALYCALLASAYSATITPYLHLKSRLNRKFKQKPDVAANLLSLERLTEFEVPENTEANSTLLAIITPLGPGHEKILSACRTSVEALEVPEKWAVEHIVIDDSKGQLGRSRARNDGIKQALQLGAQWLFFLDSDDVIDQKALIRAEPLLPRVDALWGLIASFDGESSPRNREFQLPFINEFTLLLAGEPYLTLQIGHFVRCEVAAEICFDESLNCGEDFKFYYALWSAHRCLKVPLNFFYNRRGLHSQGPRSATGAEWSAMTRRLTSETIDSLTAQSELQGSKVPTSALLKSRSIFYLSNELQGESLDFNYPFIYGADTELAGIGYLTQKTRVLHTEDLKNSEYIDNSGLLLVDLRYTEQRFFNVELMIAFERFNEIHILAQTSEDALMFSANCPRFKLVDCSDAQGLVGVLARFKKEKKKPPRFIFLAGYSRSGSTMAYNMLATTVTNYQFFDADRSVYDVMHSENQSSISKRALDIFDSKRISRSAKASTTALVVCYGDPRSILTSRHRRVEFDYFMGYDKAWCLSPDGSATYTNPGVIDTHEAICRLLSDNNLHSVTALRYEDLIKNTDSCQKFYGDFFGWKYQGQFSNFHEHSFTAGLSVPLNSVRAPDVSTLTKWRDPSHEERLRTQFARCPKLYRLMGFYGYSVDPQDWKA
jgi:glycosyltransferase involved in cell wall biosynthesis